MIGKKFRTTIYLLATLLTSLILVVSGTYAYAEMNSESNFVNGNYMNENLYAEDVDLTSDISNEEEVNLNDCPIDNFTDVRLINNSKYFINNPKHADNDKSDNIGGTCTTVAMQMLMGYHNYYSNRRLIPENAPDGTRFLDDDYGNLAHYPEIHNNAYTGLGGGEIGTEDSVFRAIFNRTTWPEFPGLGQNILAITNAAKKFVKDYSSVNEDEVSISSGIFSKSDAISDINNGTPIILGYNWFAGAGSFHVVPAYGYAKLDGVDGFIVHMGYKGNQTQVWVPAKWFGFQIRMSVNHWHGHTDMGDYDNSYREISCEECGFKKVDKTYLTNTEGNEIVKAKYTLKGEISLPTYLYGKKLTSIGDSAFANQTELTKMRISLSVTTIGKNAFLNCSNLASVTSINYVNKLGEGAFKSCKALTSLSLPSTLVDIGKQAFSNCSNLSITVASGNPKFSVVNNILFDKEKTEILAAGKISTDYIVPASITTISDFAFEGNENLGSIHFYHNPVIGESAFLDCTNLSSVYFYSYEIPTALGINCFANTDFVLYTPYVCQETYLSKFGQYTNRVDSIKVPISYFSDGKIVDTENVFFGSIIENLPVPIKIGYEFLGWYNNAACEGQAYLKGEMWDTTNNVSLYAKWNAKQYIINFEGEHSIGIEPIIVYYDSPIGELPIVSREGYTFLGWKTNDGNYYNDNLVWKENQSITLTSDWNANDYTITLNANGGKLNGLNIISVKYNGSLSTKTTVTREGYTFEGWYDSNNVQYITAAGDGTMLWNKANNETLFAHWSIKSYEIQINDNGSITWLGAKGFSEEKTNIEYGTVLNAINLIASFKRSSHGFKEGQIFNHFEYNDENLNWESVPDLGENNAIITIVPKWVREKHTIYFNTGFDLRLEEIVGLYADIIQLPTNINRVGYTFKGWKSKDNVFVAWTTMPDLTPNEQNNGSITLYADWENYTYIITYMPNGGTGTMIPSNHRYGISQNLSANQFTKVGYTFIGWSKSVNGAVEFNDMQSVRNLTTTKDGNVLLYAQWEPNLYDIILDMQGGTGGDKNIHATYGKLLPSGKRIPTKNGYTFAGYYSKINGGGVKYYSSEMNGINNWMATDNATLYAHWEIINYTIEYVITQGKNPNKTTTYTVETENINFEIPTGVTGYTGTWSPASIPQGSTGNISVVAVWTINEYTLRFTIGERFKKDQKIESIMRIEGYDTFKKATIQHGGEITVEAPSVEGYKFHSWQTGYGQFKKSSSTLVLTNITASKEYFAVYDKDNCVAEGTLITLADGSQKTVQELTVGEQLLVWNLMTGQFDTAPVLFIDSDPRQEYEVINLQFSDGTNVKVITEHAFWDFDLNQYVFLRADAAKYIGHWFNKQTTDTDGNMTWTRVKLIDVVIQQEYTSAWSPVTYSHLCYYVNGMLSMPGATEGLINIFDVDYDTMKINEEAYNKDIEKYGLFTYEEFSQVVDVPKEMFEAFNGRYLKVAIGKGLLTRESIEELVEHYAKFF